MSRAVASKKASKKASARPQEEAELFETLKVKLTEQRQEILSLYKQDLGVGQDISHDGDDEIDRANFDFSRELALSLSTAEREVILQIGDALDRLDRGLYGSCSNCSKAITEERLRAIPWALHCVECQELLEKGLLDA